MNYPRPEFRRNAVGFAALVDRVAVRLQRFQKLQVQEVVEAFAEELFAEIRRKGRAHWPGRGVFRVTRRKSRSIVNPQTGKRMRLPKTLGISFRAAKAEKERLVDGA